MKTFTRSYMARLLIFACIILVSTGCTTTRSLTQAVLLKEPNLQVWPAKPAQPRIVLVAIIHKASDLGIQQGFFQDIGNLLFGEEEINLVNPIAVLVQNDVMYVADPGVKAVHRFDLIDQSHTLIKGENNQALPSPVSLSATKNGDVIVADSFLKEIFWIRKNTEVAVPIKLSVQVKQPTGVVIDEKNSQLYVVDTADHNIKVFGFNGEKKYVIGKRGIKKGEFNYPTMIWQKGDGQMLVTDSLNFRIQTLAKNKIIRMFGSHGDATGDLSRPKGVATDKAGHIYVVDSLFHSVQIFNLKGQFLMHFGNQGQQPGEFWLPTGIFIDNKDIIYVADSRNKRVQVFRYIGGPS